VLSNIAAQGREFFCWGILEFASIETCRSSKKYVVHQKTVALPHEIFHNGFKE
jgi:hypothetical protein